jgi:hypothetical protein
MAQRLILQRIALGANVRFKVEYLADDLRVCGWIFPAGAHTLALAVAAAKSGPKPEGAAGFRILDGEMSASVVWGESLSESIPGRAA